MASTQNPRLAGSRLSASDPAVDSDAFAASTEYNLTPYARGLYCNTDGDVYVDCLGGIEGRTAGTNRKFTMVAGGVLPICITKIYNTTTATGQILY